MRPLSAAQVLALWDAGQTRHPIDRALLALALAMPEEAPDGLADRPVGWREVNLLALRNATFGSALDGYAPCPSCGALMEFSLDGAALLDRNFRPRTATPASQFDAQQWRLPSSRDQAAILAAPDPETAVDQAAGSLPDGRKRFGQNASTVNRKKSQKLKSARRQRSTNSNRAWKRSTRPPISASACAARLRPRLGRCARHRRLLLGRTRQPRPPVARIRPSAGQRLRLARGRDSGAQPGPPGGLSEHDRLRRR
jgi:hypothetical protein